MKLSIHEFYLLHAGLIELMLKHRNDGPMCKSLNKLIERVRSESKKLADKYDMSKAHELVVAFKKKYYKSHLRCPVCTNDEVPLTGLNPNGLVSTYIGYVAVVKEDGTVDESYKDENTVKCKCGWKGIAHDLIP